MDNKNRPHSREKNVSGQSSGVNRRGSGLGTGRVGSTPSNNSGSSGNMGRPASSGGGGVKRAAVGGGAGGILAIIVIVFVLLFNNGSCGNLLGSIANDPIDNGGGISSGGGDINNNVAAGSRSKRTQILGGSRDVVTLMVYMCGTDLESKYGMATADMQEMLASSKNFGDNFNVIVYTGGCKSWQSSDISNSVNQIYSIKNGKRTLLKSDGNKSMVDPNTLSEFIRYCASNYPANRNELILWDHGGGSVSGYGYDEKNSSKGSMSLAGIDSALKAGGITFDFIGFDACLMATAENALMLDKYADYLIASEETEPGIGWYYTNWLNAFSKNTSLSTLDVGKNIVDDFITKCASECRGQKTTLSVIDLAEFANTVPEKLIDFSRSVSGKISQNQYKDVSDARYNTREFAASSKIDQVDLVDLADNMNTAEGRALSAAIKSAVKYNRTSSNMTNAYGVSIYFPYRKTSYVDKACNTYELIGMDSEYADCIKKFAQLETSGQIAAGGSTSPISSLFGLSSPSGSSGSSDIIGSLIGAFLGTSGRTIEGLDSSNTGFMQGQDIDSTSQYLANNYLDASKLVWKKINGKYVMELSEEQWGLVHGLDLNMFYYDGEGYVDMGLDNVFSFDDNGNLVADTDKNWVSINGQPVAYYHTDTIENPDGTYTDMGYVPAMLNGTRVNLIIVFEGADAYIAGATDNYDDETDTVAKSLTELKIGDKLDFICDFYTRDLQYQDSYYIGEQMTVTSDMEIMNIGLETSEIRIMYLFTDIYNQKYWSEAIIIN
ncbi:MAG: peptidase C11 [Oscillospiraceae bacterium]|nr:peptidase C11 [Oscillospiraceae bacterium]